MSSLTAKPTPTWGTTAFCLLMLYNYMSVPLPCKTYKPFFPLSVRPKGTQQSRPRFKVLWRSQMPSVLEILLAVDVKHITLGYNNC